MTENWLKEAASRLTQGGPVAALTGAGVSAESGVPTFRGPGGLWENHRPEDLATPQAFARDPALVWRWYNWRRGFIAGCRPNSAHTALASLEQSLPGFRLITQNVDGLHRLAGSRAVSELHGSIWTLRCTACGDSHEERSLDLAEPPLCPDCGGLLRHGVVWFGESLDPVVLADAFKAAQDCGVMIVAGTSALVQPAAGLARLAKESGAFVIEMNLEATPNSSWVDLSLRGKAGEILPRLAREVET